MESASYPRRQCSILRPRITMIHQGWLASTRTTSTLDSELLIKSDNPNITNRVSVLFYYITLLASLRIGRTISPRQSERIMFDSKQNHRDL